MCCCTVMVSLWVVYRRLGDEMFSKMMQVGNNALVSMAPQTTLSQVVNFDPKNAPLQ